MSVLREKRVRDFFVRGAKDLAKSKKKRKKADLAESKKKRKKAAGKRAKKKQKKTKRAKKEE